MKLWSSILKAIDTIWKHHVEVDIEIKASPETLDEGHRTCSGPGLSGQSRFFNKECGKGPVDKTENLSHDFWFSGKQPH